jgi:O-antigen/teichoic acid export membrane protein
MLANFPATHIAKVASRIIFPMYSKLQNNNLALNDAYLRVLGFIANIAIPASVGLICLAPELIEIVYGDKWIDAVVPLQILCVFGGVRALVSMNGYLLNAIGKPNIDFYLAIVRLAIILIILYPMTIKYGLNGAAIAVTIPLILQLFTSTMYFRRHLGIDALTVAIVLMKSLWVSTIIGAILLFGKAFLAPIGLLELVSLAVLGSVVYLMINYKLMWSFIKKDRSVL